MVRKRCSFCPICLLKYVCISVQRLIDIYLMLWVKIHYYYCHSDCPRFAPWQLFQVAFCSFILPSPILKHFLTFYGRKDYRPFLCFLCTNTESTISPTSPGSFYWRTVLRNQNLHVLVSITQHILINK